MKIIVPGQKTILGQQLVEIYAAKNYPHMPFFVRCSHGEKVPDGECCRWWRRPH